FGEGTNQQNLPLEMKEFLIPDDGYVIYEIDLSQAENRIVAYIAPDEKMIQAFEDGIDIHSLTGSFLCEMPIEVVKAQDKLHKSDPDNPDYLSPLGMGDRTWRYWGKQANHALNYGMYYKRASLLWEIPEKDAKFIYE